jgi:hypothetical protein
MVLYSHVECDLKGAGGGGGGGFFDDFFFNFFLKNWFISISQDCTKNQNKNKNVY